MSQSPPVVKSVRKP